MPFLYINAVLVNYGSVGIQLATAARTNPPGVIVLIFSIPIIGVLWLGLCFLVARHLVETRQADPPVTTSE